jgi:hypothetical protein
MRYCVRVEQQGSLARLVYGLLNYAAARFTARASRAFFRLDSIAAFRAGDIFFLAGAVFGTEAVFLTAAFFGNGVAFFTSSAFAALAALALVRFAISFAFAAAESLRFGFVGSGATTGAGCSDSPRILAHRRCWASFIRFLAAAENCLRLPVDASGVAATSPDKSERSSAIWASIRALRPTRPSMAALMISFVNFGGIASLYSMDFWLIIDATPTRPRKEGTVVCVNDETISP